MPRVSVIMGVYNGAARVEKAVTSIINQTFTDWELILCDDGSSDNSYEVLKKLEALDKRIIVIKNNSNMGLARTLNHCLKISKGEYIARMDDDDFSHPNRLNNEVEFLDSHPEYSIVASCRNMCDEKGVWGQDTNSGERKNLDILIGNIFAHPTVMIRKEAYDAVDGYSTFSWIGREEDTDLWCKMYVAGYQGYVIPDILLDYFESRKSMTRRKYKYRIIESRIKIRYFKGLQVPVWAIVYVLKPLIVGLIPFKLMEIIHHRRFS